MSKKTILITGCSQGGLGDALARAFSRRGHRVIATGRNPSKLAHFKAQNIETLTLDVLSASSISSCIAAVANLTSNGSLDILINNSGAYYSMPLADASISESRTLFDLNVWSVLAVTQAFLPLLLKSPHGGMVVNQTSIASVVPNPMAGIYNMSKAAVAQMTDNLRVELAPFGLKVVDLKTGAVSSKLFETQATVRLPEGSIYSPAREAVEKDMRGASVKKDNVDSETWAEQVVGDLLMTKPKIRIWRGGNTFPVWFARRFMPYSFLDGQVAKLGGLNVVREKLTEMKHLQ
ncbi:hypothetical protein MMC08_007541 [Hypocenomyce scalaris]|nr:hypothetical protein [Hypocenomyce scalaris]